MARLTSFCYNHVAMRRNPYPGKFIVFEGPDGSGQTTQANLLKDFLIKKGYQVLLTKEPTRISEASQKIRQALDKMHEVGPRTLQEWFAQDRREHLDKVIVPALKRGEVVISDRYCFSSFAYGRSSGIDLDWLIEINNEFLLPDLTFILKVSPKVCLERIEKRGEAKTLFEAEQKLARVWQVYQELPARFENLYIIDGEKSAEEVHKKIKEVIQWKLSF
jgi:dTMP kinase